jgi:PAS domain S-box-containing protein
MPERALTLVNHATARKHAETRLRHSDELFRLLVENVKDYAIFLLDPDGKVATWNQGAERIKGYKADEIIGQHFSTFYPKESRDSKWPEHELQVAEKEGRFVDEGLRIRKDGSTFWAYVVITALRDENGELRGFSKVTRDLSERKAMEERMRQLNKELRDRVIQLMESQHQVELRTLELQRLSGQLFRVQDEERRKLARTLHDDLGQELTALKIELDIQDNPDFNKKNLTQARDLAQSAVNKVRNISYLLHPPLLDELGLMPALHWYFEGLQNRGQLRISFEYNPIVFPRLPGEVETTLFRVIQESLTNIYRHSESQDARIEITQREENVTVRIRDFGKGMPGDELGISIVPGVGINGMKERVKQVDGEFRISRVDPGTLVEATIPTVE